MRSGDNVGKDYKNSQLIEFKKVRILHPKMNSLLKKIKSLIDRPGGNEIIILMGPSGVGKSTLIQELCKNIISDTIDEIEENKSKIPLVTVELVSPDSGSFNWKDFYIRTLEAMNEPLINKKILRVSGQAKSYKYANHNPRTAPELRRSIENAFYYREPKVFIIDEAQHFTKMASGKRYTDQLDTLKSLSNLTRVPLLLGGTYEMSEFINASGQLARRTIDIQFPRYDYNHSDDINNYIGIILGLLRKLPISFSEEIINNHEFIYERTLGCVGILKDWLVRALNCAVEAEETMLTIKHLEDTAFSINKIFKLLEEIEKGEELFIESEEKINKVRNKLGLNRFTVSSEDNSTDDNKRKKGKKQEKEILKEIPSGIGCDKK